MEEAFKGTVEIVHLMTMCIVTLKSSQRHDIATQILVHQVSYFYTGHIPDGLNNIDNQWNTNLALTQILRFLQV